MRLCRSGIDADDARVRIRRAQDRQVQHAGQLHVVDVGAFASDEPGILLAEHPAMAARLLVVVSQVVWRAFGSSFRCGHELASAFALLAAHWMDRTIVV